MLQKFWINIRSSLWFVPTLLVLAGLAAAGALVELDIVYADLLATKSWKPLLNAGADGARAMLGAIATSAITVAGVAFSITIVSLSLASTQYTPRILRNFMRDRANQIVLGTFVGVFSYCLLVLRTIRGGAEKDGGGFVPLLAVAFALVLALVLIGCLIFFIHHIASSIQASRILNTIHGETSRALEVLHPEELGAEEKEKAAERASERTGSEWQIVAAEESGYVQHTDAEVLLRFAEEHKVLVRLNCVPGDFVAEGLPLAWLERSREEADLRSFRAAIVVGEFRTIEQDASFGFRQIVDIALKALSPGVNDTSTAVSGLEYLSAILCQLSTRQIESPYRGSQGELRVIAPRPSFGDYVAKSFDEIRRSAEGNVTILVQILRALQRIASVTRDEGRRAVLLEQTRATIELANRSVLAPYDRVRINQAIERLGQELPISQSECPLLVPPGQ